MRNKIVFGALLLSWLLYAYAAPDTLKISIKDLAGAIDQNNRQIEFLQVQNQTYQGLIQWQRTQDAKKDTVKQDSTKSVKPVKSKK